LAYPTPGEHICYFLYYFTTSIYRSPGFSRLQRAWQDEDAAAPADIHRLKPGLLFSNIRTIFSKFLSQDSVPADVQISFSTFISPARHHWWPRPVHQPAAVPA
jgi:hypothetical protein